jgi:hypothetical protein
MFGRERIFALPLSDRSLVGPCVTVGRRLRGTGGEKQIRLGGAVKRKNTEAIGLSTPSREE